MYTDFEQLNHIWGWKHSDNGGYEFDLLNINNAIAGDTDSIYHSIEFIPEDLPEDELIGIADDIGKYANEAFPRFCMHAFNCPEDRKNTIKTDREIVSDKSFFLSKKRYIMHVIDSEGKRCDKIKMMGVELKKSDTSKAIKILLNELVMMVLDGKSMEEVLERTNDMKYDFKKFGVKEIAKPISVNTLKKCEDEFRMTGSTKGFPYNVKAAMNWNINKTIMDKKIEAGEKVGHLYVKHPKFNSIAFPIDMTIFPDWFNEEVRIDYDKEWEKANKKLTNYLTSLGWDFKSRNESKRKELFGF